jgi:uncharacterized protein YfaP (DUF2135 family)
MARAPGGRASLINAASTSPSAARVAAAAQRWRLLPLALRVVIRWDLDDSDVELSVVDPRGDRVSGLRHSTPAGGLLSRNFTCGYGTVCVLFCSKMLHDC